MRELAPVYAVISLNVAFLALLTVLWVFLVWLVWAVTQVPATIDQCGKQIATYTCYIESARGSNSQKPHLIHKTIVLYNCPYSPFDDTESLDVGKDLDT